MTKNKVAEIASQLAETNNNILALQTEISTRVADFQNQLQAAQEQDVTLRAAMIDALEATGNPGQGYEDANLKITYVKPGTRTGVDATKLQLEQPEIYEQYKKTTSVRSQVRIKVK